MELKHRVSSHMALALILTISSAFISTIAKAQTGSDSFKSGTLTIGQETYRVRVSPEIINKIQTVQINQGDIGASFAEAPDKFSQSPGFSRFGASFTPDLESIDSIYQITQPSAVDTYLLIQR